MEHLRHELQAAKLDLRYELQAAKLDLQSIHGDLKPRVEENHQLESLLREALHDETAVAEAKDAEIEKLRLTIWELDQESVHAKRDVTAKNFEIQEKNQQKKLMKQESQAEGAMIISQAMGFGLQKMIDENLARSIPTRSKPGLPTSISAAY